MNTAQRLAIILCLILGLVATSAAQQRPDKPEYLSAAEILKLVTDSETNYSVKSGTTGEDELADPLATMFPTAREHTFYPVVNVGRNGERSIAQFQFDPAAFALVAEAEPFFQSNEFERARELCQRALDTSRNCYLAYAHLGDSWLFTGDPETALPYYDSAIAINQVDYQPNFYKANALLKAGRFDEAREQYIEVLALNPRHENTYLYLSKFADELEITFNDALFRPKSVARQNGDGIDIVVDLEQGGAGWMAYGMAKGMWLGEPEHRKELTGSAERVSFSTVEETECVVALLSVYSSAVEEGKVERDEQLDRLLTILKEGYLTEFLLYEFGSRIYPDIMLLQPDELRASMREFIAKYVVVRNN